MSKRRNLLAAAALMLSAAAGAQVRAEELPINDYPTVTRADYVYACMQVNGQTRDILEKCSCSIDNIAALMPFNEYEEIETIMSVQLRGDKNSSILRQPMMQERVKNLKRAQVEAELRCF